MCEEAILKFCNYNKLYLNLDSNNKEDIEREIITHGNTYGKLLYIKSIHRFNREFVVIGNHNLIIVYFYVS